MLIKFYFKVLKKLKILAYFNFITTIKYSNQEIKIPLVNGLGYPNLFLTPNWLYSLINKIINTEEQIFIDVGANIGQTLIAVKSSNKSIQYIGFEPNVSCCYYLHLLLRTNRFTNCHVYNFALSDKLKEAFLATNSEADPTGSIFQNLRPQFFRQQDSIFSLAFDNLGLNKGVACIKIDVEGGELEVLQGMQDLIKINEPFIICEVLDSFSDEVLAYTQNRADQVCLFLKANDYSIVQLVQNKSTDRIIGFNELGSIVIKQWNQDSLMFNDYIFFPSHKREIMHNILKSVCQ